MAEWLGAPKPPHVQAPRRLLSVRYPWPCRTLDDVAAELDKCPEWALTMFAVDFGGARYGYDEAHALLPKPAPMPDADRRALAVGRAVLRHKAEADALGHYQPP